MYPCGTNKYFSISKLLILFSMYGGEGDNLPSMPASFRSLLRKYEEKLLMMDVQPLDCSDQDKRMSEYTFETGKMSPEKYEIIHNGPDFTEVMTEICTCVITLTRHDVKIVQ